MKIIKFGGTAFQTPKLVENACEIINLESKPLVVVVSAIGRKGFPFATDTLIESIKDKKISDKEFSRLLGLGEIYSTLFFSNELLKRKINSYALSYLELGIDSNDEYLDAKVLCTDSKNIEFFSKKHDVLIVPGFIGKTKENEITTLGRGTSDLTAVLLAKVLKENEIILYKDIDGIYPTMYINLSKIEPYKYISYDEVLALINIGYSPINKKAIEEAKLDNILIKIKNLIYSSRQTIVSDKSSQNRIIGFNVDNNKIMVATLYVDEIKNELFNKLKEFHIYVKEDEIGPNYFSFKLNASQVLMVRQVLLKHYFNDMIRY